MPRQELLTDEVLNQEQQPFFEHFDAFLNSSHFDPGKKYEDWICVETSEGYKGLETNHVQFSLKTEVLQIIPGVVLVNSRTGNSVHSMIFRDNSLSAAAAAGTFLNEFNATLSQENTEAVYPAEKNTVDSFILKMYLGMLNQLLISF